MTDRPILFNGDMVRAVLDGSKTQTRRILMPQPRTAPIRQLDGAWTDGVQIGDCKEINVRFAAGDRLYVRETFAIEGCGRRVRTNQYSDEAFKFQWFEERLQYIATDEAPSKNDDGSPHWWNARPGIHMPRWASRLTLPVTEVRIQRLQDISEEDAKAEGATYYTGCGCGPAGYSHITGPEIVYDTARESFMNLWDSINANRHDKEGVYLPYAWEDNPWVIAISFEMHLINIDQIEARNV